MTNVAMGHHGRQRGIVLLVALIALVMMTLAGIALVRSVDTGLVIAGNMAFKQATLNSAEVGSEEAIAWLNANATVQHATSTPTVPVMLLDLDAPADAYYATYMAACDLTGNATASASSADNVNWIDADHPSGTASSGNCGMTAKAVPAAKMPSGYSASYVINRMCVNAGSKSVPGTGCAPYQSSGDDLSLSTKNAVDYRHRGLPAMSNTYYRITVRVLGPRSSLSYIQTLVGL